MERLLNIALSDDPSKVIAVLSEKYIDEHDYVNQFLFKIGNWLEPSQSCSTNKGVLRFLQTLFGSFSTANLSDEVKQFTATKLLHVIEYEDCSISNLKYALNSLKSLVDKKLVNMLMMDESLADSMQKLGRKLTLVGDFQSQKILLQVLSKIARNGNGQFWSTLWFTQEDIRTNFLNDILGSTLYLEYRKFLNLLNRSKDSRVFSFIAQSVILGTVQLKKPPGSDFWIDVNFESKSISFWYEKLPNETNSRDYCIFIPAKFVKKYTVRADTAAKFQELCIILNCSVGDLLDNSPFSSSSDSIKIRFWRFLDINDHLENVFGASSCESDICSKTHKRRKISNSQTFCSSDPQRYTHSKRSPGHRKMSRSCEFVPTSDVEPTRFRRRKVSNSTDIFSIPDSKKISIDRLHRPKKASMSCDIFAFSGNEVLVETQRSSRKKISCSSGIIAVGSIEDKNEILFKETIPRILRSSSTSLNKSRQNSKSRNLEPALDIIENNTALSEDKSLSVPSIKDNIVYMESRSIAINEKNVPLDDIISPKVSPIQKILPSNNIQSVLSQIGCISDKGERKQISPSHSLHSTPTNKARIIISSRKKLRTSNLDTVNENSKSPAELDCLVPIVNSFSEKGLAQEINLNHNEENSTPENALTSNSNKKPITKSQKMVKLYNVDGSPVQIQRLSKNISSNKISKARRTSLPNKLMPIEDNSPRKVDSSSDFDFIPLNRNKPKSSGTNKDLCVSNDSGFKEQSSAPNLSNKPKTDERTSMSPREDTPRENVSHEDITTETYHFNACSPNNQQEGNERTYIEDENTDPHAKKPPTPEWNDIQYTLGFCKDPKGAKLSRIVTQPLEDETESVIENKLNESMKIMKARSTSGSSGSFHRRSLKESVRPKKVLKKLFISDTETESSSAASWAKKKQVHLFHSPVHTYYKRKTMQTVSRTTSSKPKRNESIQNKLRNPRKRNCREGNREQSVQGRQSDSERSRRSALSELDCVDLVVENCNKPSAVPLSRLHRTVTQKLLSDAAEGDNTGNNLAFIPGDSVSDKMCNLSNSYQSVATKGTGRHVYEPYIINLKTQENTKSTMNNASKRKSKDSVTEVEPNMESIHFTDANPGTDEVCQNSPINPPLPTDCPKPKPPINKSKTFNRKCTRDSSINPEESALGGNENTEVQDGCPDHSKKTSSYDHEEIAPTEECSTLPMPKGSRESYLLIEENVNSIGEESGKEFQMQRYFQSVSEESFSGKERNEESNKMEGSSNVNKSIESVDLEFPSGVAEQEPPIDYCLDSMSSTEKASQSEVLHNKQRLIEEKELHSIPEVTKELTEKLPRKQFRSKKRKYEDNDSEGNNKTQPTKSTQEETETHEYMEIINEKLRKRKACQRDETPNSSSKKKKDLKEMMNNNKAHSMEKSTAHVARDKSYEEMRKFKKHTEKFENILESSQNKKRISKDINESTGSQVYQAVDHSLLLDMVNQEKNKRKGLLSSTPKARKEISYLKKKHCLSLLKLEEEINSLNHRLLQTLKKYSESFRIDVAITRQSILRCTEMMLQESDYCEKDLEYLYANVKQRSAHITKSIKKIMYTANEYFEMERKRARKMRHVETKAIGKFISSIHKAEQQAVKSVQQQILIEAQETFNGFLKSIIYY